jgi:hypothetical protein
MKKISILLALFISISVIGQNFEDKKSDLPAFDGMKVKVGGQFTMQFQGLDHSSESTATLEQLVKNFNLPTANLDVNAYLAKGVKMHLRTYLSARHHNEAWVKGGYLQIDNLDFIKEGFAASLMEKVTFRFGQDELNYGDAHFRRTDNAQAINNPFVGNYIMDSFTTEIFGDVTVQSNGFIGVLGLSNGKLNNQVYTTATPRYNQDNAATIFAKLGYDKQLNEDLRVRITGSYIQNKGTTTGTYLYSGDRAGSRYYYVLLADGVAEANATGNFATGRFNPGFKEGSSMMFNPFVKYKGLEFFGVYEIAKGNTYSGSTLTGDGKYTQFGSELLYRFGKDENLYIGGRYNSVKGKAFDADTERSVNRINIGGGWFMTKNILTKVEYVKQSYSSTGWTGTLDGGEFKGLMVEATISF